MIATEASAFLTDDVVSYLWTSDTCGYGLATNVADLFVVRQLFVVNGKVVHFRGHFDHSGTSAVTIERISRKAI